MSELIREATGLDAIAAMFDRAKSENRAAFLPFFMIGYPDYEQSIDAVELMANLGADGFEIGIPFSDSLADGPVNQMAAQKALDNGMTVAHGLNAVRTLRERGVTQPMLMFSCVNPLLAYGVERFVADAKAAGADGFIIPDLPPEEAHLFAGACAREGMALVFFITPTSTTSRIHMVGEHATGFIYVVSVTGITGTRRDLPPDIVDFIQRVRPLVKQPLVLGFGISTPEHARAMNGLLDGFIVGSALVRAAENGVEAVGNLAKSLRDALN